MSVAQIVMQSSLLDDEEITLDFEVFPTVLGYASFEAMHDEEEITTPGVDGKRWRTVFSQIEQIVIDANVPAVSGAATHTAACDLADKMRRCKGRFGVLSVTSGGARTIGMEVHITAVSARVMPGPLIGPGLSGYTASVFSSWVLDVTDPITQFSFGE